MGLDQFLMKVSANGEEKEVIYWRKANFVHRFFTRDFESKVFGDDNCTPFPTTEEELKELVSLCEDVLDEPYEAPDILPTMSGFFFGSTDYDDWYFDDVRRTKREIDKLLKEPLLDGESYYYTAWY